MSEVFMIKCGHWRPCLTSFLGRFSRVFSTFDSNFWFCGASDTLKPYFADKYFLTLCSNVTAELWILNRLLMFRRTLSSLVKSELSGFIFLPVPVSLELAMLEIWGVLILISEKENNIQTFRNLASKPLMAQATKRSELKVISAKPTNNKYKC
jgi:hypothetical protein